MEACFEGNQSETSEEEEEIQLPRVEIRKKPKRPTYPPQSFNVKDNAGNSQSFNLKDNAGNMKKLVETRYTLETSRQKPGSSGLLRLR